MLKNLHALCGLAALAVVFYHLDVPLPNGLHTDFSAVAIFFVISGYLMRLTSSRDRRFFIVKRLFRVLPTLWIVTLFVAAFEGSGLMNPPYTYPLIPKIGLPFLLNNLYSFLADQWPVIVRSLLLFPRTPSFDPIVGVSWTLTIEVSCYVIFGACLAMLGKSAPLVAVFILMAIFALPLFAGYRLEQIPGFVSYQPYFCVGVLLSYAKGPITSCAKRVGGVAASCLAISCALTFLVIVATPLMLELTTRGVLLGILTLALTSALPVITTAIADGAALPVAWPLLVLGDISFSLYLIHSLVIETFRPVWAIHPALAPHTPSGFCVLLGASVLAGVIVYRLVERPFTQLQHALIRRLVARYEVQTLPPVPAHSGAQ